MKLINWTIRQWLNCHGYPEETHSNPDHVAGQNDSMMFWVNHIYLSQICEKHRAWLLNEALSVVTYPFILWKPYAYTRATQVPHRALSIADKHVLVSLSHHGRIFPPKILRFFSQSLICIISTCPPPPLSPPPPPPPPPPPMVLANIWKQGVQIGFIDFCVSKVCYKVHTTNKINPIYLQILLC